MFYGKLVHSSVTDSDISIEGYNLFRNDRLERRGGGLLCTQKISFITKRRRDFEVNGLECIWLEIHHQKDKYLIGTFYRPRNSCVRIWDLIEQSIELASDPILVIL